MTREEAIAEIKEKTPKLLADYRALADALKPMLGMEEEPEEDKPEIDPEELQELYEGILEFAEGYDIDSIDSMMKQAAAYRIPEAEKERFAAVERCVRDSDWEGLKKVLGDEKD
ncbi:MAG: hypothetical protein IJR00_11915 [Lachnospiraceae bacterium]|nr:hypothetical protein [Lachnospiraceae bacterium]